MDKEIIKFDDTEIEECKFHQNNRAYFDKQYRYE